MCRSRLRNSKLLKTLSALVILLLGTGLGSALASAQESPDDAKEKLEEIEAEIEAGRRQQGILERQSQRARRQADALSADLIESARAIQLAEGNVSRLETRIQDLETETASKRDALLSNNENIVELIAAIERLSKRPAVLTLLKPDDALTTARSTGLMASLVPLIDERAGALRTDLEILAKIQTDLSNERFNLKNELQGLTNNQDRLAILLDERKAEAGQANQRARQLERELREFADEARSLRELIAKLEQQAATGVPSQPGVIDRMLWSDHLAASGAHSATSKANCLIQQLAQSCSGSACKTVPQLQRVFASAHGTVHR